MRSTLATIGSVLLSVLALGSTGAAQSDGVTSHDPTPAEGIPSYPGLPPNSGDIIYDSGDFTGGSRNLQNAGINPGWSYWAHQVRFTPAANMQGELLEVRYVASTQWGSATIFDLVIRDSGGAVITSMSGLSATMDTGSWQVIDVSSLNFVPASHGGDFYVELQPSTQCSGVNGFTIAYSNIGSGRSAFTGDCTNPFGTFVTEARDLFIRAVVELDPQGSSGSAYCFGDGSGAACPCAAIGGPGEGCANSGGAGGATLTGSGNASITSDSFQLDIVGVPGDKPGLILRGANQVNGGLGNPAGDGLLCASGNTARSHVQVTSAGNTTYTDFNGSAFGAVSYGAGVPANYQFWYRDPANTCSGSGFNFTNAWTVTWQP